MICYGIWDQVLVCPLDFSTFYFSRIRKFTKRIDNIVGVGTIFKVGTTLEVSTDFEVFTSIEAGTSLEVTTSFKLVPAFKMVAASGWCQVWSCWYLVLKLENTLTSVPDLKLVHMLRSIPTFNSVPSLMKFNWAVALGLYRPTVWYQVQQYYQC